MLMAQAVGTHKAQLTWIDNIKIFATLAVIGIHVSAYGVGSEAVHGNITTAWWVANFYESWFRCSVPLFVMITGALLLPQEISPRNFLRKRFNRILTPFIFWSAVYIFFKLAIRLKSGQHTGLGAWLWQLVTQGAEYHLWYVYMLIGLYLFIPIIQPWIKTANNKTIHYFLSIWIIVLTLKQFNILDNTALDLRYFGGYLGYLVLGYYISDRIVITDRTVSAALLLVTVGFAVTFCGTYLATQRAANFSGIFYDFLTVNVGMLSTGVFMLMKGSSGPARNTGINKLRKITSAYGYGIYLSHPFILNFMVHYGFDYKLINPLVGIPLVSVLCMILSFGLVYLISKLPYGKYISG
jgi:surface polysaccharide O-acyltransferase-like enzyme